MAGYMIMINIQVYSSLLELIVLHFKKIEWHDEMRGDEMNDDFHSIES
jgi:hypothetical protein